MEVQLGPNPIDEPNLLFKLQRKLKVFNTSNTLPNRGYNLVASASKYGIVFVASPDGKLAVYYLRQLIDKDCEPQHLPIQLQEKPTHIAVSCNDELLAVTGGQLLAVYKVTNFQSQQNISPSLSVKCDVNPSTFVSDLKWNPCIPDTIAVTFFDGTIIMLQASNGQVKKVQSKARCLCWSPKGKQLVVGNSDGTLCQYKPDLTPAKTIPAPNIFDGAPVEVLAIHWISTFQFAVVYRNASDNSRPAVTIVNTPKGCQPTCQNYEDICYSMGNNRPWYYYLQGLASWNIVVCASSNSMEMATIGSRDSAVWSQWCQVDEARPELPMTKNQENYPVGLSFNLSAIHQLPWGESETLPPMPMLLVVSQTGLLAIFNVVNLSKQAPMLCEPPQTLTLPSGAMISVPAEPTPSQASPALTAALQAKPGQAMPTTQPTQRLLPTPPTSQPTNRLLPTPAKSQPFAPTSQTAQPFAPTSQSAQPFAPTSQTAQTFEAKSQGTPLFAPKPQTQSMPTAQAQPFMPTAAKPAAAQLFGAANLASKPFGVPQSSAQTFAAPQPQPASKPAEVKPSSVSQPATSQAQTKPEVVLPTDTQNAALKAEQENANKLKANQEFKNMLIREVNEFQMELYMFERKTRAVQNQFRKDLQSMATNKELQKLDVEAIKKDCSLEELRNAVIAQKLDLVRTCAVVADARTQADAKELDQWTQADPLTTKRVASVKKLSYYIQNQLGQAHKLLEYKWNQKTNRDIMMKKSGHAMIRPMLDDVYQSLVKQQGILDGQQAVLKTLTQTLKECDASPKFKSTSILRTTPFKNKDPLLNLTKNVLNMSIEVKPVEEKNTLNPLKLDALRDMLSNHKTVKIKPVNVEMRHHLAAIRVNYEKSEKEKANAQIALIKKPPVKKAEPKPIKIEPKPVKIEPPPFAAPEPKPVVKMERPKPLDQTKVTPIESQSQIAIAHTSSGQFIDTASKYAAKKLFDNSVRDKFEQSSIEELEASYEEEPNPKSTGLIIKLVPYQKSSKSVNVINEPKVAKSPLKAIENTLVDNIGTNTRDPALSANNSGTFTSDMILKPKSVLNQSSLLQTSIESMGGDDEPYDNDSNEPPSNANITGTPSFAKLQTSIGSIDCDPNESLPQIHDDSSGHVGETVTFRKMSTKTERPPVEQKPQEKVTVSSSSSEDTAASPGLAVRRTVKPEPSQSPSQTSFTPINMKAGAAPNAVRTLFTDEAKQETSKQQPQIPEALTSNETLKELLLSNRVTIAPKKKEDSANTFMGQNICSPTCLESIDFSSVIVATPTSYTTKPISELSNMFKQFAPQAFASSGETGEQETPSSPKPDNKPTKEKPMSSIFSMKTSTPLSSSKNVPDVLATSEMVTIKRVEPKSDKVDEESKENVPDKASENVILNVPKIGKEDKKVLKPLSAQNETVSTNSQPAVTSDSATKSSDAEKADTETSKDVQKSEASSESAGSIFTNASVTGDAEKADTETSKDVQKSEASSESAGSIFANASVTVSKPLFGPGAVSSSAVTQSTAAKTSTSSASSIFAKAAAAEATKTEFPSIFQSPTVLSPTATEPGSIFGTSSTSSSSIFGTAPATTTSSIFGSTTTEKPSTPTTTATTASSVFGSMAKSFFSPAVATTATSSSGSSSASSAFGSTPASPTSAFASSVAQSGQTSPSSIFGNATSPTPDDQSKSSIFGTVTSTTQNATATTTASIFSTPTTTSSIFGSASSTTQPSVFGGTQSTVFGSATTQASIFGSSATTQASAPVFGSPKTTEASVFSSPQTTQSSGFGATSPSVFGSSAPTNQGSIFGGTTQSSVFGSQAQSVFGAPQTTQPSSIFGTPATTQASIFGGQTTQASVFGSPTATTQASTFGQTAQVFGSSQPSAFGAVTTANSMFGSDESLFSSVNITTTSAGGSKNIFGGSSSGTSVFGSSSTNVFGGKSTFGQPDPAAAAIFGGASTFGQSAPATNLWGSNNSSGGGFGSPGFGQQATTQSSSVFGSGSFSATSSAPAFGSPTQQTGGFGSGFGSSATFAQPARFGSPSSGGFGAPASFGGLSRSPGGGGFGAAATFGGAPAFGGSAFGGTQAPAFGGGGASAGFGSPTQSNATFESLATQNTLTFGNLAQQTPQQSQPAPSFNTSPSFTGWRG